MKLDIAIATLLFLLAAFFAVQDFDPGYRPVPTCAEDAVLIGAGDFDKGRWSYFECGPAVDDYDPAR